MNSVVKFSFIVFLHFEYACWVRGEGPKWPLTYTVKGAIEVPYAEIWEPFQLWFDNSSAAASRIDYYNGIVKTYQLGAMGEFGTQFKVEPVLNKIKCFETPGFKDHEIKPETLLPDMLNYTLKGKKEVNGVVAEEWVYEVKEKNTVMTMYLRWEENSNEPGSKIIIPVRLEKKGADHVYIDFEGYSVAEIPSGIFTVENAEKCVPMHASEEDLVYGFSPARDYVEHDTRHVDSAWQNYKRQFAKEYADEEETKRKDIFRQKIRYVHSMNRANLSYSLGLNHMADYTPEELKVLRSCMYDPADYRGNMFLDDSAEEFTDYGDDWDEPLPARWDWRSRGAVTPVKDQSMCGSCWSFSATGAVEGAHFVKTGKLLTLSEQALVDCSWSYHNFACDGGFQSSALAWVAKHGLPIGSDYGPYLAEVDYCHLNKTRKRVAIKGYRHIKPKCVECMKRALIKSGPLSVGINADPDSLLYYRNGVYNDPKCAENHMNHAVLIVGYDSLDGKEYWIVKNSWSNYWGMDGYVLMAIKGNTCRIMDELLVVKA